MKPAHRIDVAETFQKDFVLQGVAQRTERTWYPNLRLVNKQWCALIGELVETARIGRVDDDDAGLGEALTRVGHSFPNLRRLILRLNHCRDLEKACAEYDIISSSTRGLKSLELGDVPVCAFDHLWRSVADALHLEEACFRVMKTCKAKRIKEAEDVPAEERMAAWDKCCQCLPNLQQLHISAFEHDTKILRRKLVSNFLWSSFCASLAAHCPAIVAVVANNRFTFDGPPDGIRSLMQLAHLKKLELGMVSKAQLRDAVQLRVLEELSLYCWPDCFHHEDRVCDEHFDASVLPKLTQFSYFGRSCNCIWNLVEQLKRLRELRFNIYPGDDYQHDDYEITHGCMSKMVPVLSTLPPTTILHFGLGEQYMKYEWGYPTFLQRVAHINVTHLSVGGFPWGLGPQDVAAMCTMTRLASIDLAGYWDAECDLLPELRKLSALTALTSLSVSLFRTSNEEFELDEGAISDLKCCLPSLKGFSYIPDPDSSHYSS